MLLRHYESELRYLREGGAAFAEAHPEQAGMLRLDALEDRDPYVERLLEGVAFLSSRVQERLDDDLPEYTQRLVGLLYPHFLRPFPSCCILELTPKPGMVPETTTLPRGIEVLTDRIGPERVPIRFQTAQDVRLHPMELESVELRYDPDKTSRMRLLFSLTKGTPVSAVDLSRLRLFLHAESSVASTAHLLLTRHVTRVEVRTGETLTSRPGGGEPPVASVRGQNGVQPAALEAEDGLLPHNDALPSGLRLLQEMLLFRRKFWQVELVGLEALTEVDPEAERFAVDVVFDRPYPEDRQILTEHVKLHCTPAVNLFDHDAEPMLAEHTWAEQRVIPSLRQRRSIEAYDVEGVVGVEKGTARKREYARSAGLSSNAERSFDVLRRSGATPGTDLYLQLAGPDLDAGAPVPETLSVAMRCTNGALPYEMLQPGMVDRLSPDAPKIATVANLDRPSMIRRPPMDRHPDLLWALLAHWSFSHGSVATQEAVTGLLDLYDWADTEASRRRRRGIREVSWAPTEVMNRGALRRGAHVTIKVTDGHFADDGDLALFGLVMSEFLSLYATLNAFVHLTVETVPSGRTMTWTPDRGQRPIV
ncbi:type VI secretion system baseplate subunit TssF [Rubrivirga sp.]|uniref:type VI secretion system baseplate subunit TssF n=1 Tax=Rubrivirga sp. TaxID=1885344 RepID=UPI003C72A3F0